MKRYKLVTQDYKTRVGKSNETEWCLGVRIEARGDGGSLCTDGVIHFYDTPAIATFMNPIHANIQNPLCIAIETENEVAHDGTKGACKAATRLPGDDIPLPRPTANQRAYLAVTIALDVCKSPKFQRWAKLWLSGDDRTRETAREAWDAAAEAWEEWATLAERADASEEAWTEAEAAACMAEAMDAAAWAVEWVETAALWAQAAEVAEGVWAAARANSANLDAFRARLAEVAEMALKFESGDFHA